MTESIGNLAAKSKTAFYVFDIKKLKQRVAHLRSKLPVGVSLCYAVKANTFIAGELRDEVERFEICSPGEANICAKLGIDTKKTVISGVYKTPEIMKKTAYDEDFCGIFTVESMNQYRLFCELSERTGQEIRLLLRLTNGSQFGIDAKCIEEIISNREDHPYIRISGIQFFSGTQKTSLKKYKRELEKLDAFLIKLKEEFGFEAEELEYGTGFPAAYFESDELDEDELLSGFSELLCSMTSKPKMILEIGRSIAASCGRYYTHIVDIKENSGQNYAIIDGGMHHLVYFGQHMAMKKPFFSVLGKENAVPEKTWTICGSLCSMNDIAVKQAELPEISVGDTLCFENTGAYCMTEGISLFLSRDIPAVWLFLENGELTCVRRSFETEILNTPDYERNF